MKHFKVVFGLIAFVLVGIPTIAINLYGIGAWETFSRSIERIDPDAPDQGPPAVLGTVGKGLFDYVIDSEERSVKHALFNVDAPTKLRSISVTRLYAVEDVLKPGEDAPEPALHELYLLARAPALVMAECPAILDVLAKACAVSLVEVEPKDDGLFEVQMRIGFLPLDDPGDLSLIDESTVVERRLRIDEYRNGLYRESDLALIRRNIYATAQATCEGLREAIQTCVVKHVAIDQRLETPATVAREAGYTVSASFVVAHLKNTQNQELLAAVSNGMINAAILEVELTESGEAGAPETPPVPGENGPGVLASLISRVTGGGGDEPPPSAKPTVLNGGGAFGGGNGGTFVRPDG